MERRIDPIPALSPRSRWELPRQAPEQARKQGRSDARRRGRKREAQGESGEPVDRRECSPSAPEPAEGPAPEAERGHGAGGHIDMRA